MAAELSWTVDDQVLLYDFMIERFSLDELKDLAFRCGINYELFENDTRQKTARGLISHCTRTNTPPLSCLIGTMAQLRPDPSVAAMLLKLPSCKPNKIVQIVISKEAANYSVKMAALKEELARLAQKYPDEIGVLGVMAGSVRILLSLPADGADALLAARPESLMNGELRVESLQEFDSLPLDLRLAWKAQARAGQQSLIRFGRMKIQVARTRGPIEAVHVSSVAAVVGAGTVIAVIVAVIALLGLAGAGAFVAAPRARVTNQCGMMLPPPELGLPIEGIPPGRTSTVLLPPGTYAIGVDGAGFVFASIPIQGRIALPGVRPEVVAQVSVNGRPLAPPMELTLSLGGAPVTVVLCAGP